MDKLNKNNYHAKSFLFLYMALDQVALAIFRVSLVWHNMIRKNYYVIIFHIEHLCEIHLDVYDLSFECFS